MKNDLTNQGIDVKIVKTVINQLPIYYDLTSV